MKKSLLLVVNPNSGKTKAKKLLPKIITLLEESNYDITVKQTEKSGDAKDFVKDAFYYDLVVCVGGDGTLNEVVSGFIINKIDTPLGYIPMGSTNDFARSLKLPTNYKKAIKDIVTGSDYKIDACKFNDRYFIYVASVGIFTKTSCSISQKIKNKLGRLAYIFGGAKEVFTAKPISLKIEVENQIIEDDFLLVAIGNTRSVGGVLKFDENLVKFTDGKFELILFKYPQNLGKIFKVVKNYRKKKFDDENFRIIQSEKVKIFQKSENLWSLDGESFKGQHGEIPEISAELLPNIITFRTKDLK